MTIDQPLLLIFFTLSILYIVLLLLVLLALLRLRRFPDGQDLHQISIIIAARNESLRITECLNSLACIDYPPNKYEVVIVDDHSSDNTSEIIEQFTRSNNNWRLIRLTEKSDELRGKKNALKTGIEQASGDLIFTTDADCIVNAQWLKKMSRYFIPNVPMVIGFSPLLPQRGILQRVLQFDTLFSAIATSVFVKFHYPFTSTGRNLAYRTTAYHESGGFAALRQYRSGDDMHLTRRIRKKAAGRIDYCVDPETFVYTQAPTNIKQFWNQQIRKNSKTLQTGIPLILFGSVLLIYHILCYILPIVDPKLIAIWGFLLLLKLLTEFFVLTVATFVFKQKQLIPYLPLMQFCYPLIISLFSVLGLFQIYQWKK